MPPTFLADHVYVDGECRANAGASDGSVHACADEYAVPRGANRDARGCDGHRRGDDNVRDLSPREHEGESAFQSKVTQRQQEKAELLSHV